MTTTIKFDSPAIEELANASAQASSLYGGLEHMAARGQLGTVAQELTELAEQIKTSGYVPPFNRAEHDKHDKLAKSVNDRELAKYHRDRANAARSQMGEVKK